MSVSIIAEHNNQHLNPTTLCAVAVAARSGNVDLLIADSNAAAVVEEARQVAGIAKIPVADASYHVKGSAEELAPLVIKPVVDYRYVVATTAAFGKNLLPRVTTLLDVPQVPDLIEVVDNSTFVRPICADSTFETVQSDSGKLVLTFRATAFDAAGQGDDTEVTNVEATPAQDLNRFVNRQLSQSGRPESTQAKVIVSGGRALDSAEKFNEVLTLLANVLDAAIGASRAVVDVEYVPNDAQVRQTGKVMAPQLYFAIGIPGTIRHAAGMQDDGVIVAVNKDADAPAFDMADCSLTGDLFEVMPQLTEALKN